jgi:arabinose-5-phosphate isomerase
MGKSGHVARKIAATLASTGAPALYVHPAEASHGDMGMLTVADGLIALSNSGETPELSDIVGFARRHGLPLVALTGVSDATLARHADAVLALPAFEEACPLGLAPTTSTTAMLALGDALAVALLERRLAHDGFSADAFRLLHPGGRLGRRLLKTRDLMHSGERLPLVAEKTPMRETLIEMTAKSFGCVGVTGDRGALVGIITDGDLRRHLADGVLEKPAAEVMTRDPVTVAPDTLAGEALALMNGRAITSLFVVEDGRIAGLVHIHDLLRAGIV